MNAALAARRPFDIVVRGQRTDGETFLMRIRGAGVEDADGNLAFIRGSTQDITEQRETEIAMARAEADREAAAREHAIATELQQSLLPPPSFAADQLDIAAYYRPGVAGTQVGGDWHDVIDLGDGRTAVVIGDVMGRGVRAAAVMGQLRAAGRAYARLDLAPAELLRLLDATVREVSEETIVTCVYAVYDPDERTLTYANAGHLPPLVVQPGQRARRLLAGGPPLGAGPHGDIAETVPLPSGSLLALYTDGLVERRGSDLDDGIDKLADVLATTVAPLVELPSLLVDRLVPEGPDDDVAILVCRANDEAAEDRVVRHDLGDDAGALAEARRFVGRTLTGWGVPDALGFDVLLAVSELATNAINHGSRPIQLRLRKQREHLLLEIRDSGSGVPSIQQSPADAVSGRGLLIVAGLAERWGVRPSPAGKTVWAQFRLPVEDADQAAS
jgi:serine phosphatase RsbU (regulator of sigma subunit)/anti-sigma regulatory factor (Ser/Thr protein kinase)